MKAICRAPELRGKIVFRLRVFWGKCSRSMFDQRKLQTFREKTPVGRRVRKCFQTLATRTRVETNDASAQNGPNRWEYIYTGAPWPSRQETRIEMKAKTQALHRLIGHGDRQLYF